VIATLNSVKLSYIHKIRLLIMPYSLIEKLFHIDDINKVGFCFRMRILFIYYVRRSCSEI
jgi:hypothetical protein